MDLATRRPLPSLITVNNDNVISFITPKLEKEGYTLSEKSLLQAIEDNKSKNLVYYAVLGLKKYGTKASIDSLKRLVHYPSEDVQVTSVLSIATIAGRSELNFYSELLDASWYRYNSYPMSVLWELGTDMALLSVIRYAERVLKKTPRNINDVDILYIVRYLERYSSPANDMLVERLKNLMEKVQRVNPTIEWL